MNINFNIRRFDLFTINWSSKTVNKFNNKKQIAFSFFSFVSENDLKRSLFSLRLGQTISCDILFVRFFLRIKNDDKFYEGLTKHLWEKQRFTWKKFIKLFKKEK